MNHILNRTELALETSLFNNDTFGKPGLLVRRSGKYGPDQFFGIPTACPLNALFDGFG